MRLAFITPTLHTLGPRWQRDPQIMKLAAPTVAGFLRAHGYTEQRQYEFEVEIFALEDEQPGKLDLRAFFDDVAVDRFLTDDDAVIRAQSELIVDTLEIDEADLFGFSCASTLELYADMHATGSINLCIAKVLKERFPGCKTVMGGLQISPDEAQRDEYRLMLDRCADLDFAIEGAGEIPMLYLLEHLKGERTLKQNGARFEEFDDDRLLLFQTGGANLHIPKGLAAQEGIKTQVRDSVTPEEKPDGDHERKEIFNPSLYVTPWYDPRNVERRKVSGLQILKRYHLDTEWVKKMVRFHDDQVVILPMIFMEGCNSRCSFCAYSMTKMAKREISEVVRALAWVRETYDVRYFHFLNTNINGYYKYAEAFADEVVAAKLDILWSDCANLRALDRKLLEKLRASGCIRLTFGLECPSDKMLKYIHKGVTVEKCYQRLAEAHDVGIWNHLLLITGLPHETEDDISNFVEFLERTKDQVHGFSISSFYLINSSLMGAFPERYGIEMMPNPSGLLEDAAFNEAGGLDWARKKRQIIESTRLITETIRRLKVDPKYWSGSIDLELLFWLYDRLGHDNKAEIVRCYEEAFIGAPSHPKFFKKHLDELLETPTIDLDAALSGTGWRAKADEVRVEGERVIVPLAAGDEQVDVELRCHHYGSPPTLGAGRALGATAKGTLSFADRLSEIIAEGGRFAGALEKVGWQITERGLSHQTNNIGFRIEKDFYALDLLVANLAPGEPAAVTKGGLGFLYMAPHDKMDPTKEDDPTIGRFLQRMGRFLLEELAAAAPAAPALAKDRLQAFAAALIAELEAPFDAELSAEPLHEYAEQQLGPRHGDRFGKVAASS